MKALLPILAACALSGCCADGDIACKREQASAEASTYVTNEVTPADAPSAAPKRVTVTRIDVVADSTAYSGRRGVYIIKDNATGREFVGVAGVGVSELGDHQSGKVRVQDER